MSFCNIVTKLRPWTLNIFAAAAVVCGCCGASAPEKLELQYFEFDPELRQKESPARDRLSLNGIWDFQTLPENAVRGAFPKGKWSPIKVPSYWNKPASFEYPAEWAKFNRAWYRKNFDLPAAWQKSGDRVGVYFGAVMAWCQLYVNGQKVPTPENYGCLPVTVDITSFLRPGVNTLDLEVQNGTYYHKEVMNNIEHIMSYAGIWQDVYLFRHPALHTGNVHIKTSVRRQEIAVDSVIVNLKNQPAAVTVRQRITTMDGRDVKTLPDLKCTLAAGQRSKVSQKAPWADPVLWEVDNPNLYLLNTEIINADGQITDRKITRFGFREFRIDGQRFLLNEKPVYLRGAWDNVLDPLYPEAMNRRYGEVQFKAMRGMNVNTLRWHSGKSFGLPLFYNLADEHGILAVAGVERTYNGFPHGGKYTTPKAFPTIAKAVLRDRNHPSIILWSGNNEAFSFIYWEGTLRDGPPEFDHLERFEDLINVDKTVKKYDATRPLYYHGNYDLFGYSGILNVHYPVYVVDLISGNRFFRSLKKSTPAIFRRNKPIVVGEFWFVPHLREFSEKYCGDTVFDDINSAFAACAEYHEKLILGWREDRTAGILSFMTWFPFNHPMRQHISGTPVKLNYDTFDGPYMKPSYTMRPAVNPGWDKSSPEFSPNVIYDAHRFAFQALVAYMPLESRNGIGGKAYPKEIVVINDSGKARRLEAVLSVVADGKTLTSDKTSCTVNNDQVIRLQLKQLMPQVAAVRNAVTRLELRENGRVVSQRDYPLTVYPASFCRIAPIAAQFQLYDPQGRTAALLQSIGVKFQRLTSLEKISAALPLIIGYHAPSAELAKAKHELDSFVNAGGRVLYCEQARQGSSDCDAFNQSPGHPALDGIAPGKMSWFQGSDSYVTAGAFPKPTSGNFRILIDCDVKRAALLEIFQGRGLIVRNQMDCTGKYGSDPVATRLFNNLLAYIAAPRRENTFKTTFLLNGTPADRETLAAAGLGVKNITALSGIPADAIVIAGENALDQTNATALRTYAAAGGSVIALKQQNAEALRLLCANEVEFAPTYTGESYRHFLYADKTIPANYGINNLDMMDWPLWQNYLMPVKLSGNWRKLIELREGPNAFLHNSLYPPRPGKKDPVNMIRAEIDPAFARDSVRKVAFPVIGCTVGRGSLLLLQLDLVKGARRTTDARRVLAQLLTSAGVPAQEVKSGVKRNLSDYKTISLASFATVPFKYSDEHGGWSDQGAINDLGEFPVGLNFFADIPFEVADPAVNNHKGCVALASSSIAKNSKHHAKYVGAVRNIPIGEKVGALHLLLGASYATPHTDMADMIVRYADGTTQKFTMRTARNVADWWYPAQVPEAVIGWVGKNASCSTLGMYVTTWKNPFPAKKVVSADLVSRNGQVVPLIAGLTAERSALTLSGGVNDSLRFRNLEIIPTRIEANGTFSSWFTVKANGKVVAADFGCRLDTVRKLKIDNRTIEFTITGFDNGKVVLHVAFAD